MNIGVPREDLEGWGYIGLVQAARSFDPQKSTEHFWVRLRVRGAIIDGVRTWCASTRHTHVHVHPDGLMQDAPLHEEDFAGGLCDRLDLRGALAKLPERERIAVVAHARGWAPGGNPGDGYMAPLAQRWGVTTSRVAQIRTQGLKRLRAHLGVSLLNKAHPTTETAVMGLLVAGRVNP